MKRYLLRIALIGSAVYFVFPMIPGTAFHATSLTAFNIGVLFTFLGWVFESLAIAISELLAIGPGLALRLLVPAWLLGFWLLPALVLRNLSDIMPESLAFSSWGPAIWCGLVLLCIGILTSSPIYERFKKTPAAFTW